MTHFKIKPLPLTQEQKDWYEANMKRETRPYEPAMTLIHHK